ncbi:hypothetical protein RCC89_18790 [Cytophagaceae bacterium ABcell3]|nr:hypothetical protein RCC89_18790 [Cytophagaceae bacterium ABcell3]
MKYLIALMISFGMISTSLAQSGQELEELEEEGEIACFFIDENTIACFQEPVEEDTLQSPNQDRRHESDTPQEEKDHWDRSREEEDDDYRRIQTFNY